MNNNEDVSIFWFRRDLRLNDNRGLSEALRSPFPVLPLFIFDTEITEELAPDDSRIGVIYQLLGGIHLELRACSSGILCKQGRVVDVWKEVLDTLQVRQVYCNEDYEPYAIARDEIVRDLLSERGIPFFRFKDQVVFAKDEVLKNDGSPYTVFTPYKNKWLSKFREELCFSSPSSELKNYFKFRTDLPKIQQIGFRETGKKIRPYSLENLDNYSNTRDFPALDQTSHLSVHLRFGAVSIREIVSRVSSNQVFLSELIWREFFMQILFHFPNVIDQNFKRKYDAVQWRNNPDEFERWKNGETGYPLVDAGMRELNASGYMHNRVRMVVAGFLCKHLLIDWRWGEAYFAEKLMDYELSSNNGNWQWAAGTGCDAAPYFRIFNPIRQAQKFDPENEYINNWIPDSESLPFPASIVEHKFARKRAISTYKEGLMHV